MKANLRVILRNFRGELGLSQEKLAARIDSTVRTVARWELSGSIPIRGLAKLILLARDTNQLDAEIGFGDALISALGLNEKSAALIANVLKEARTKGKAA